MRYPVVLMISVSFLSVALAQHDENTNHRDRTEDLSIQGYARDLTSLTRMRTLYENALAKSQKYLNLDDLYEQTLESLWHDLSNERNAQVKNVVKEFLAFEVERAMKPRSDEDRELPPLVRNYLAKSVLSRTDTAIDAAFQLSHLESDYRIASAPPKELGPKNIAIIRFTFWRDRITEAAKKVSAMANDVPCSKLLKEKFAEIEAKARLTMGSPEEALKEVQKFLPNASLVPRK